MTYTIIQDENNKKVIEFEKDSFLFRNYNSQSGEIRSYKEVPADPHGNFNPDDGYPLAYVECPGGFTPVYSIEELEEYKGSGLLAHYHGTAGDSEKMIIIFYGDGSILGAWTYKDDEHIARQNAVVVTTADVVATAMSAGGDEYDCAAGSGREGVRITDKEEKQTFLRTQDGEFTAPNCRESLKATHTEEEVRELISCTSTVKVEVWIKDSFHYEETVEFHRLGDDSWKRIDRERRS